MGIKEQIVFLEIDYDKIDKIRGLDICITTSAKSDDEAFALLKAFNFPLRARINLVNKSKLGVDNGKRINEAA